MKIVSVSCRFSDYVGTCEEVPTFRSCRELDEGLEDLFQLGDH